jgi:hypothetical protein
MNYNYNNYCNQANKEVRQIKKDDLHFNGNGKGNFLIKQMR